ncbi:MAG: hypothetical protein RL662_550 [Bacteroidota bacterium]|jgi:hypothetical protein
MIKHIVCWKLKEQAEGNNKATNALLIKEKLEALQGKIEGLKHIEVGINIPEYPNNYDVMLYSEIESKEALSFYQTHPLHQAVLPFVKEVVESRVAVDYEI